MREEYRAGVLDLVREELAEVLHVHPVSLGVHHSGEAVELDLFIIEVLDRDDDVRELAYAGRLDEYPVRIVFFDHLIEGLSEVSHEGAAYAARYHLVDLNAGLSQESRVHADLAEFVLDQNDVLRVVAFGDEFSDECRLACSEKSGEDIHFCHLQSFFLFTGFYDLDALLLHSAYFPVIIRLQVYSVTFSLYIYLYIL